MPDRTEDLIAVTYKGIPFFVRSEEKQSGRKVAIHEYPGSDIRFVEDLGKIPDIFTVNGFVHGENWKSEARRLSHTLDEATEGVLEFVFGIIKVKAQTYREVVSQTEVGVVDFYITFLRTVNNPAPVKAKSTKQTVSKNTEDLLQAVEESFAEQFVAPSVVNTIKTAVYEGVEAANGIAEVAADIQSEISNIVSLADTITSNINSLIQNPFAYAEEMFNTGLMGDLFDILPIDGSAIEAMVKLTKFGNSLATDFFSINNNLTVQRVSDYDIPLFNQTTFDRIRMNNNRKTMVNSVRVSALAMLCEQAARADYQTDDDINDVKNKINTAYNAIVLTDDVDANLGSSLDKVRLSALDVLDQKLQLTPNLVEFDIKGQTTNVLLAYDLYEEQFFNEDDLVARATVLSDLNGLLPTKLRGNVLVLEENV